MDFGVTFQTGPPASRIIGLTQRAESLGFTHAWTFDSHVLWQEPYVIYAQMLAATERITVGPTRFVRKSLSFSKSDRMHEVCLRLFLHRYNLSHLP